MKILKKTSIILLAQSTLSMPIAISAIAQEKPLNIVCLVCEDISPYLGCYGDPVAHSPNIDRLAKEGVRYTNLYGTHGVCAPNRSSLITGMYPSAMGTNQMRNKGSVQYLPKGITPYDVVLPEGVKCFTEYLRTAGYYCTNNGKTDYQFEAPLTAWDENGETADWKNAPKDKPFYAVYNFGVTHESQIWKRGKLPLTIDPAKVVVPPYYPDNEIVRKDIARMYSNIETMDELVQSKIDELKDARLLDNTIIIFYSDNGGPLPRQKRSIYNSGLQVPMIIRYPHMKDAGTVETQMCSFIDIPATILSLAGVRPPEYMHGKAFAGKYRAPSREYVYGASDRCDELIDKIGTVRDRNYQYIRNYMPDSTGQYLQSAFRKQMSMMRNILELRDQGKLNETQMSWLKAPRPVEEFYDVDNDPNEIHNLINDERYKVEIQRLKATYNQWVHDYNGFWMLTEKEARDLMLPGGIQPVTEKPVIIQNGDEVKIFCPTPGTSIAYQINGKGYNEKHWFLYTGAMKLQKGDTINAIAVRAGYKASQVAELTY